MYFTLHYSKIPLLDIASLEKAFEPTPEDREHTYNPFQIRGLQHYNPIYSLFFEMSDKNYDKIALNHPLHIKTMNQVLNTSTKNIIKKPVFIKYSPLLDPVRYMIGKYKTEGESIRVLPTYKESATCFTKLANPNNASYTDNFFSYLAGQLLHHHGFCHGLEYYGSFLGIQKKFKMNITDDADYLQESGYFLENINKLYTVTGEVIQNEFANFGSRSNKTKLAIQQLQADADVDLGAECLDDIVEELKDEENVEQLDQDALIYAQKEEHSTSEDEGDNDSDTASESESASESDSSDEDEDEGDDEDYEDEDDEDDDYSTIDDNTEEVFQYAYIHDFPVQLICLEKCEGTLDDLFLHKNLSCDQAASALFQVIMILLTYQKVFHFTHNDLHTNNIMYVSTELDYITYQFNKKTYKVPTYGRLFKLIDFGRSIYRFQNKLFCSDSFAPNGDAATQYNCEPYMNDDKPRIDPNYSFDLCRLGCSIYDFVIDTENTNKMDELQKTVYRWCQDDSGKNVLYKRNGDERYPNFKLYKMIARTVHQHTPENQLDFPYFNQFLAEDEDVGQVIINIDTLPSYA
jgi:hypothetical protein